MRLFDGSPGASRLGSIALAFALTLVGPAAAIAQDTAITTGNPEADAIIEDIEVLAAEAAEAAERLSSDRLDPEVLLESLGDDPHDILEWLSETTRWLPYEGALRGASGVLMARGGSSLDRSLLLAELLSLSGVEVRLANARLPDAVAVAVAERELGRTWPEDAGLAIGLEEDVQGYRSSVAEAAATLAAEVGLLAEPLADAPDQAVTMADHWWVQASSDGEWIDLDPLFTPDAADRPPAERTLDPASLPADLLHSLTVRTVIESIEDGALAETTPLEHTVFLGSGQPLKAIGLSFAAAARSDAVEQVSQATDLVEAAEWFGYWRPILDVDGDLVRGEWFSDAGRLESPQRLAQAEAASSAQGALSGLGAKPTETEPARSYLSGVWIEYETNGPGLEPRIERREVFDALGAARAEDADVETERLVAPAALKERGLALLGDTAMLLQTATPHPDELERTWLDNTAALRPALIAGVFLALGVEDERITPSLASARLRPYDLLAMAAAREAWATSPATFVGRPNVWSSHFSLEPDGGDTPSMATDIVLNDIAVLPDADRDPRLIRLEQGILDTLVEHAITVPADTEGLNTWERFERREADGEAWVALRPGAAIDAEVSQALPATDLARMQAALAAGDSLVVAAEPRSRGDVAFADWWRIGPDGDALGMGYRGWGQVVAEKAETEYFTMNQVAGHVAQRKRWERIAAQAEAYANSGGLAGPQGLASVGGLAPGSAHSWSTILSRIYLL